ncbi:XTP/dITP diphosphatase [Bacillus sp. FSL K6-3431]|uniref:XTP/dITP diphosphatase n=1 Tax=Bacillus sp. FSL K6-3431 TaxID=2921500 RepID=UPI0030FB377D
MTKKMIIATKNIGKVKEFEALFFPYDVKVLSLLDLEDLPDIEETGSTFEENAVLKAEGIARLTGTVVIADDSGLIIDELDGSPGIFSARYAGTDKDDNANIDKVLMEMKDVPEDKRTARFYCALAFAIPGVRTEVVAGKCEGKILGEREGVNGFGYDPIFYVDVAGKSMAEILPTEKNRISHRSLALKKLEPLVADYFKKR